MNKPIPAALRDALKACNMNQSELAQRLGIVDRQVVNNWIARRRVPRFWRDAVLEIAKGYREGRK
jgi:transcriptional regulator with XRE-family HTH domain